MMHFQPRTRTDETPIAGQPAWLSPLLRARGVNTPEEAERFLNPSLAQLHDPLAMPGMEQAVRLIRQAVRDGDPVTVWGDYDCDGVCASSILWETLCELGARADYYLPDRHGEGYGLGAAGVRELAEKGCRLLVTVDCGITNVEEVRLARSLGLRVIVTDHHQPGPELPPADALLNPQLGGYPWPGLCGAGVALKLSQALAGLEAAEKRLDLAALATVADIVPLLDENRAIVAEGLKRMESSPRPGLRALLRAAGVEGPVRADQVAFRLAPRINAGGRLEHARQCVALLTTRDETEAERIAGHLNDLNARRQAMQTEITRLAEEQIRQGADWRDDRVLLAMGDGWESGVVGLAAGKLCEKLHWPVIALSRDPQTGIAVGSCRSIPGVNIFRTLSRCAEEYREEHPDGKLFERFGGHAQAAGLTLRAERLPEFRRLLNRAVDHECGDLSCYVPAEEYDAALSLKDVTRETVALLDRLQPTGCGNPPPVFLLEGLQVGQARAVGQDGSHLKLSLSEGAKRVDAIGFGFGAWAAEPLERLDLLAVPQLNEFMGRVSVQLQVQALRPTPGSSRLPGEAAQIDSFLQEIRDLAENYTFYPFVKEPAMEVLPESEGRALLERGVGTLWVTHSPAAAQRLLDASETLDLCPGGRQPDPRSLNTLLLHPGAGQLRDQWRDVVLLDAEPLPGELTLLREKCPRAVIRRAASESGETSREQGRALLSGVEAQRELYRALRRGIRELLALEKASGLNRGQTLAALEAMREVGLIGFERENWTITLPADPPRVSPGEAPIMRYLTMWTGEEGRG